MATDGDDDDDDGDGDDDDDGDADDDDDDDDGDDGDGDGDDDDDDDGDDDDGFVDYYCYFCNSAPFARQGGMAGCTTTKARPALLLNPYKYRHSMVQAKSGMGHWPIFVSINMAGERVLPAQFYATTCLARSPQRNLCTPLG